MHAVEAHQDVQRIGNAQAEGANPFVGTILPSTPRQRGAAFVTRIGARKSLGGLHSLQALMVKHGIRNAEKAARVGRGEPIRGR
jgi:hypothetical protein